MKTSPLVLHAAPAAGFEEPFAMLDACHERVQRMCALLLRLAEHLRAHRGEDGADAPAQQAAKQAAQDVMRYFDLAGPAHHEDEERHVLPALRASGDPALAALADRLHAEHAAMAHAWAGVRADLQDIAAGAWRSAQLHAARTRWQAYAQTYARHIQAEEAEAYPAVRQRLSAAALHEMGGEMARRRGLPG